MFAFFWILFVGLIHVGSGLTRNTRYERTRYVSSRNQIYGGNFDFNEKYIPFVHYWERPLQILESSMKIPKKLSSRPLFSWDLPIQISTYTPSKKTAATVNSLELITETTGLPKLRESPDVNTNAVPNLQQTVHRSRLDRARASVVLPDFLIPKKQKKSGNRKKSIQEIVSEEKNKPKIRSEGRLKKKKKVKKSKKGKSQKNGKRRKATREGRKNEMNDQVNEVNPKANEISSKTVFLKEKIIARKPEMPCEVEKNCEHRCERANGKAVCVCFRGFALEGDRCVDVNECKTNNGGCNGKCVNTIGSRKCICSRGFRLVDGACSDVNECLLRNGHGPCQDRCTNTLGSYYCSCEGLPGTSLSSDNHTCENTKNCNPASAGCSHSCVSVSGTTFCTCPDGMELGSDWKTCHDIDECSNPEDYDVHCEFGCINTIGSYICGTQNSTSED